MKIGLCSIFPLRPHVKNLAYIYKRLKKDGHEIRVLKCSNDFDLCHYKLINKSSKSFVPPCYKCRLGSIAKYVDKNDIDEIGEVDYDQAEYHYKGQSKSVINSLANIYRIENYNEVEELESTNEFSTLLSSKIKMSKVINAWVKREDLDLVVLFNGRMDILDSILGELKKLNVETLCIEGSGTDRGIRVVENESAVDFEEFDKYLNRVIEKPISSDQQLQAYSFFHNRITGKNDYEWRQYNQEKDQEDFKWKADNGSKVLFLPSSMYEFYGIIDHEQTWTNTIDSYDHIMSQHDIKPENALLRFHPNWARSIAGYDGRKSIELYTEYCLDRGIDFIESHEKVQTRELIKEADLIVVNGGSSAIEGALLGKQVVNVFPCKYMNAGFVDNVINKSYSLPTDFGKETKKERIRNCLRYLYFNMRVYPRLTNEIISVSTTENKYKFPSVNKDTLTQLKKVDLTAYDESISRKEEENIIEQLLKYDFDALGRELEERIVTSVTDGFEYLKPKNFQAKMIDMMRNSFKKGDL